MITAAITCAVWKDKLFSTSEHIDDWPDVGERGCLNTPVYPSFFLEDNEMLFSRLGFHILSLSKESAASPSTIF
jgi:hypothetical protein